MEEDKIVDLIEMLKKDEQFVGTCYKDTLGKLTIGYGTLLPLTNKEAEMLLKSRLYDKISKLASRKPVLTKLNKVRQQVIMNMAYQLGVGGLLGFKKMWKAIEAGDFETAAQEGLDSRWAKQTPNRAIRLMSILREG